MKFRSPIITVLKVATAGMLFGVIASHSSPLPTPKHDFYTFTHTLVFVVSLLAASDAAKPWRAACGSGPFAPFSMASLISCLFSLLFCIVSLLYLISPNLKFDTWALVDCVVAVYFLVSIPFTDRLRSSPDSSNPVKPLDSPASQQCYCCSHEHNSCESTVVQVKKHHQRK